MDVVNTGLLGGWLGHIVDGPEVEVQKIMNWGDVHRYLEEQRQRLGLSYADIGRAIGNPTNAQTAYQMGLQAFKKVEAGSIGKAFFRLLEVLQVDFCFLRKGDEIKRT